MKTTAQCSGKWFCVSLACAMTLWWGSALAAAQEQTSPKESATPEKQAADAPAAEGAEKAKADSQAAAIVARQQQLAHNYSSLEAEIVKLSEYIAATDPDRAALLRRALRMAREQAVGRNFDDVVTRLKQDRVRDFDQAIKDQKRIEGDLKLILELLASENRAKRLESEKARIRQYIKQLDRIIKQQEGIQGRTQGGEDAKQLAEHQAKLAEEAAKLAGEIKKNEEPQQDTNAADGSGKPSSDNSNKPDGDKPKPGKNADQGKPGGKKPDGKNSDGKGSDGKNPDGKNPDGKKPDGDKPAADGDSKGKPEPGKNSNPQDQPPDGSPMPSGDSGEEQPSQPGGNNSPPTPGQSPGQPEQSQPAPTDQSNPARRRIEAAEKRMQQAREKLQQAQREGAVEDQEQALRELNKALADLEKILRQLREEEIERVLTMLEVRFQKMLKLQTDVYKGTTRVDKIPQTERDRDDEIEVGRLARLEQTIVAEADRALTLLNDDGSVVAFPVALGQVRDDMAQIAGRLGNLQSGPITQGLEEDVIASLEEMIDALKKAIKDKKDKRQKSQGQQQGMQGEPTDPALVDQIAELKMIRSLQMRINRRTDRFRELVGQDSSQKNELTDALRRLAEREQQIYKIVRDISLGKNQ